MSTPYLILHKVRGEPAFDIAEKLDEETWIIPTSGHRAYPFRWWSIEELVIESASRAGPSEFCENIPSNWPDHYQVNDTRTGQKAATLEDLGL